MVVVKNHKHNPAQTARRARAKLRPVQPEYLTKAEGVELLDRQARKYLGMSGQEFRDKFRSGELTYDDHPEVARVEMLLSFGEDQPCRGTRPNPRCVITSRGFNP